MITYIVILGLYFLLIDCLSFGGRIRLKLDVQGQGWVGENFGRG